MRLFLIVLCLLPVHCRWYYLTPELVPAPPIRPPRRPTAARAARASECGRQQSLHSHLVRLGFLVECRRILEIILGPIEDEPLFPVA
jgi:hypothetical protein